MSLTTSDSMRYKTTSTDVTSGLVTNFGYDVAYNLTSTARQTGGTPAYQTNSTIYTQTNKPSQSTDPLGYVTSLGYNQLDQHSATTDPEIRTRQFLYDANGRLYQIIDANGVPEETRGYYPGGYLETITDANGNTSTFSRDGVARVTKLTYADSSFESWGYDSNGNATSHTTRGGNLIGQTFDGNNRILTRSPAGEPEVTIVYDAAGRLLNASTPKVSGDPSSGIFSRGYDAAGRLTSESSPNQTDPSPVYDVVSYQLDPNGNVTQITYPSGYTIQKTYDAQDRLTAIFLNGATTAVATFSYDGLNRRLTKVYNNGTSAAYAYDISTNLLDLDLTYGGAGSVDWDYSFNKVHQMLDKSVSDATYEWRPAATVTTMYGSANQVNEYPTVGGVAFSYNADGCLTNDGSFSYIYNTERMLTQVKNASGTTVISSYSYDPFLRQTQKTVVGGAKIRYVYSGSHLLEEYDCTGGLPGTLVRRYVYAGADEPILQMDASGNITYLHQDHQGSLIAQTNSSGTVLNKYVYSAFGETTSLANGSSTIGYTGQRFDAETGLFYYKARYYNSTIGRFLQPDPTGYRQGMNLYGYVHNDPLNRTDPDGTDARNVDRNYLNDDGILGKSYRSSQTNLPDSAYVFVGHGGPVNNIIYENPATLKDPSTIHSPRSVAQDINNDLNKPENANKKYIVCEACDTAVPTGKNHDGPAIAEQISKLTGKPAIGAVGEVTPPLFGGGDAKAKLYQLYDPKSGPVGKQGTFEAVTKNAEDLYVNKIRP